MDSLLFLLWSLLPVAVYYVYTEISSIKKRHASIDRKLDLLCQHHGIKVSKHIGVADEVFEAIKAGKKIEAIRLYREDTEASLQEARKVVDDLS